MTLKLLQLNIWYGNHLDRIVEYVKQENFDILHFQEVAGNLHAAPRDCFARLSRELEHNGELAVSWRVKNRPASYLGNATFYNPAFKLTQKKTVWLKEYREVESEQERKVEEDSRTALAIQFNINGIDLWTINTHLAWGPRSDDRPYKIKQAQKLYNFVASLTGPYVLTGDFNVDQSSKIVKLFSKIATNHVGNNNVTNTLNPRFHYAKKLFPPGLAVDYIFTHPELTVQKFAVIEDLDLSDHYALLLEYSAAEESWSPTCKHVVP